MENQGWEGQEPLPIQSLSQTQMCKV
jgi:hypothetical protein